MNRFTYVGAAYLFLIKDRQTLLQRRCNTGFEDGNYGVPAGHLDGGETARQGCAREISEELGIIIKPGDLTVVHVMHRKAAHDERIDFFMCATNWEGTISNNEPDKCDDLCWFSLDSLPENMIDYVQYALQNYLKGVSYSEYGYSG
jgi:ADP-ribose pyrophosphatase YjhB (NUDIX family)